MTHIETWEESQATELRFWDKCLNTYGEETKQLLYFDRMGFKPYHDGKSPFAFDGKNKRFVDIGGGPCSALLKFHNIKTSAVIDPCPYPGWVYLRYGHANISVYKQPAEDVQLPFKSFDVALIYNCLQHTKDPEAIIKKARFIAHELHIFEWINIPSHSGHPHELTQSKLEEWAGFAGRVEQFNGANECYGLAWYR